MAEVRRLRILVACEYSGRVRNAFAARGHDAWSCDILPSETMGQHYKCDVLKVLGEGWDLMVAHPPCTRLANSGVRWLEERDLWRDMEEGVEFFNALWKADIPRVAIENPVMHKYAKALIGPPTQSIQPWQFGHPESKRTCLWMRGLPELQPTRDVSAEMKELTKAERNRIHHMPPSKDRAKKRSETYQGIASAMAAQWSELWLK